jgi:ABC-2 type transport system ATP-binding protein
VPEGELFGLLGPNGAGKTTTISLIATLLAPDGGEISVGGHDSQTGSRAVRRLLGLAPQQVGLFPGLSAWENLEYFGGIHGLWGRVLRSRIREMLAMVALTEWARKPTVGKFSGGMRRRLSLAAGIIHKPRLLLLDEPTVGVDAQSRNHLFENILRLNQEDGVTVIYTTHYMEEAEALCDRVAIMDRGRIVACDSVRRLVGSVQGTVFQVALAEPSEEFARALGCRGGILEVSRYGEREYQVVAASQEQGLAALVDVAARDGLRFRELDVSPPNLEQVFLKLTGKALRDETA